MSNKNISINQIIENQVPQFVREEFPLFVQFLKQYYISLENPGKPLDILQNLNNYIKLDTVFSTIDYTILENNITKESKTIKVSNTQGFPNKYGLLKIDNEIISYEYKDNQNFYNCIRGFSGISEYNTTDLVFENTIAENHDSFTPVNEPKKVINLSLIFLKEFLFKLKSQFSPGFEGRDFYPELNENIFVKQIKDFYSSKGTDSSFKILFKAIYGKDVKVIKPRDFLIKSSDSKFKITEDIIVKVIEGNPLELENRTLYQLEDENYSEITAIIASVEQLYKNDVQYYKLGLDFDFNKDIDVRGGITKRFKIHPRTILTKDCTINSDVLNVDSTVGFPNSGKLRAIINNRQIIIKYSGKSYTSFFNCENVPEMQNGQELIIDSYCYGYANDGSLVKVFITGVLSDLSLVDKGVYHKKGGRIKLLSLGKISENVRDVNWLFNVPTTYDVFLIELQSEINLQYKIETFVENNINTGDVVELLVSDGTKTSGIVNQILNKKIFSIVLNQQVNLSAYFKIKKVLSNVTSSYFPETIKYTTNIQNVYTDYEDSTYITSPSLPNYLQQQLNITDYKITFDANFGSIVPKTTYDSEEEYIKYIHETQIINLENHGYLTGDEVVYNPIDDNNLGIGKGIYFIYKLNNNSFKLSRSRDNIFKVISKINEGASDLEIAEISKLFLLSFFNSCSNQSLYPLKFANLDLSLKTLKPENIVRLLKTPQFDGNVYPTEPGQIGLLQNGVEITSYKSTDTIFYGKIENIDATNGGSGYDVINPPDLVLTDPVGFGATGICCVSGKLERIDIIDSGSDFILPPTINITGGNGTGALAKPNLQELEYFEEFDSTSSLGLLDLINDIIVFQRNHKFRTGEKIEYLADEEVPVGGLITNSEYYLRVVGSNKIQLFNSYDNSIVGLNTVQINSYGTGVHRIKSVNKKTFLTSINVINQGDGYTNNKIIVSSSGISSVTDTITFKNHGFKSGEIIKYMPDNSNISGLSTTKNYYVTKINNDKFKLSEFIVDSNLKSDFFYKTNQFIKFNSISGNKHIFNYPPISVTVSGLVGLSTLTTQNFNVKVNPIFKGSIKKINLISNGENYGSQDIVNYHRQPDYYFKVGFGAKAIPLVSNGKIIDVSITSFGLDYTSVPSIIVKGLGSGAILSAVISNNKLVDIVIINGGNGYTQDSTSIEIVSSGLGCKIETSIQNWTVNEVERTYLSNRVYSDDGFPTIGYSKKYGIEYSHLYAPRKLREILLSQKIDENGTTIYRKDIENDYEIDDSNYYHSPILGWAYDGNPIYGPYGFSGTNNAGKIKLIKSSYTIKIKQNRPNGYPEGFFVEDYEYVATENDDNTFLDEFNGRYCVTPEYPNGTYAYFATINDVLDVSSFFTNQKRPTFPYLVGNFYKSKPIEFNFDSKSNQEDFDINSINVFRNTYPYGETFSQANYDYYTNPIKISPQVNRIKSIETSNVDDFIFVSRGSDYVVGDSIIFSDQLNQNRSSAIISEVQGKTISTITTVITEIPNAEFIPYKNQDSLLGITSIPHGFNDGDIIEIKDLVSPNSFIDKTYKINILKNSLILSKNVDSIINTGIITYFSVSSNSLNDYIFENDVYIIGEEKIKILNIDKKSNRIRVERNIEGLVSFQDQYSPYDTIIEEPRKILVNVKNDQKFKRNKTLFFDPKNSVGIGSTFGPGITTTITFTNPGVGNTQVQIPTRSIYLPLHEIETGIKLKYSCDLGSPIRVALTSTTSFQLNDGSEVFGVKISKDLIGISTEKVGIGTKGDYVGIGTESKLLFFTEYGEGEKHSFSTIYDPIDVLSTTLIESSVTVDTKEIHLLNIGDIVKISGTSGISTDVYIFYDDELNRILVNPLIINSSGITTSTSIITIKNHKLYSGQKVVYKSNNPSQGLFNNKIYYIISLGRDEIQLSESYYNSLLRIPTPVKISTSTSGKLYLINPPINIIRNQIVKINLSDQSLSFSGVSAFKFKLYTDQFYKNEYRKGKNSSRIFDIETFGTVGITSDARVELTVNDDTPNTLYYTLVPVNTNLIPQTKKNIINDNFEIINNNKFIIKNSEYNGNYVISGISSTKSFTFNTFKVPEKFLYTTSDSNFKYTTSSKNTKGPIAKLDINLSSKIFSSLPKVDTIITDNGKDAIIVPKSNNIGSVKFIRINDIGFGYPSDKTLRPIAYLPSILRLEPLTSFSQIKIIFPGVNYTVSPNLVVLDGLTKNIISDIDLRFVEGSDLIQIKKNTKSLYNITPILIPVNNSNGVGISSLTYNAITKIVTITLDRSYSSLQDFPFEVGDKILVEKTQISQDEDDIFNYGNKGFNSESYNYELFTVDSTNPLIGGDNPTITFSLENFNISKGPGLYDGTINIGRVIPQKHFPRFSITLEKNNFFIDEIVESNESSGIVEYWDVSNEYLSIFTNNKFTPNKFIIGRSSGSIGIIKEISETISYYDIQASSIVERGFQNENGFLNERTQRLHDNDYYQYFSYSLNSQIQYEDWNTLVGDINHTVGFEKFSDLVIESKDISSGISTSQDLGNILIINDFISIIDLETYYDFDLATEVTFELNSILISNEIIFNSVLLQDFSESIGNRVLDIDDISGEFNDLTVQTVVATFTL